MFEFGRILWYLLAPVQLGVLLLAIGLGLIAGGHVRAGLWTVLPVLLAIAAIGFTPLGSWPLSLLENRFPRPAVMPERVDGIIVLGGEFDPAILDARGEAALPMGGARLLAFMELAQLYPDARLVFSGGSGRIFQTRLSEAAVARQVLERVGFDADRVLFEGRSRNTRENAVLSAGLVGPGAGELWLLITDASHMPRAVGAFRAAGWPVIAYPVGFRTRPAGESGWRADILGGLAMFQRGVREWIGLAAYRLRGHTDALFPAPAAPRA